MYVGPQGSPWVEGLRRLRTYRSVSSKSCIPLQAADVVTSSTGGFLKRASSEGSLDSALEPIDTFLRHLTFLSTLVVGVKHIHWIVSDLTLARIASLPRAATAPFRKQR